MQLREAIPYGHGIAVRMALTQEPRFGPFSVYIHLLFEDSLEELLSLSEKVFSD